MKSYKQLLIVIVLLVIAAAAFVISPYRPIKLGLDIAGGARVVLRAQTEKLKEGPKAWTKENQDAVVSILDKRVNGSGVAEALVQKKGDDQFVVELPAVKDPQAIIKELQSTASLEFRYFRNVSSERHPNAKYRMSSDTVNGVETYVFFDSMTGKEVPTSQVISESELILSGKDLKPGGARSDVDMNRGSLPIVSLNFTPSGQEKFADFTKAHVHELLAIVLDGKVLSVPNITEPILHGGAMISGGFKDQADAQHLASFINAGALPVPLEVVQQQTVEATIGRTAVDQSMLAGIVGLALVIIFMVGYYLLPGLLADIALAVYALLTFALFRLIGVTLTLPGIAAYIVSIGMAVDANILIFERLKEELRAGKTLHAAIDAGFSRAFTSIFDSNMCTAITCVILMTWGTGAVKGFAVVLLMGVIVSMFTAITATRTFLHVVVNTSLGQKPSLFGLRRQWVAGQTGTHKIDVVRRMGVWFALSAAIIIPGMIFLGMGGLKKGIDFTGGSFMQVKFQQSVANDKIVSALDAIDLKGSQVQKDAKDSTLAFVRTPQVDQAKADQVRASLAQLGGTVQSEERVGGVISKEMTTNALKAVLFASLVIVLYLSIRFAIGGFAQGFRFGVCAIAATLHDVLVIVGVFAILGYFLGWEVDSLFVTALLTVIGFSTHDTIVIFDRIRENLRHRERGEAFDDLVNKSINQSLARSINTSLTVVITLAALWAFGAASTSHFIVALLVGVVTGTYSSIFNASQLLVLWQRASGVELTSGGVAITKKPSQAQDVKTMVDVPRVTDTVAEDAEPVATVASSTSSDTSKAKARKRKKR